jgi:hypothetical protein
MAATRLAHRALATLGAGIVIYEYAAPPGEQFTDAIDDLRARYPVPVYCVIAAVAAHTARVVPRQLDVIGLLARLGPRLWWPVLAGYAGGRRFAGAVTSTGTVHVP